jgi:hypothetical protein
MANQELAGQVADAAAVVSAAPISFKSNACFGELPSLSDAPSFVVGMAESCVADVFTSAMALKPAMATGGGEKEERSNRRTQEETRDAFRDSRGAHKFS